MREDRTLLKAAIEESVRRCRTRPMSGDECAMQHSSAGCEIPGGAEVQPMPRLPLGVIPLVGTTSTGSDIHRPPKPSLGFGGGPHICLGMHVARAEMHTAINALLDRLPGLRLDEDEPPPQIIGMYERGPAAVPVVWG